MLLNSYDFNESMLFSHSFTSLCEVSEEKRFPLIQLVLSEQRLCKSVSLEPIPLECDVQNGIIVLPAKLWLSRNVFIILGA